MSIFTDDVNKIRDKVNLTIEGLKRQYNIGKWGEPWPQTIYQPITTDGGLNLYPKHKTRGFLPPIKIEPTKKSDDAKKLGNYEYKDWRGQILELSETVNINNKFDESKDLPSLDVKNYPYTTRDMYMLFNDNSTDYFKHGLHIIDNLTPIDSDGATRLSNFKYTSFEKNDPVIFGFDIIIDSDSSPLLNGSIIDFLRNYSSVSEISSKIAVYEEFKQHFVKFFNTKTNVSVDEVDTSITKLRDAGYPEAENDKNIYNKNKRAYLNYYLKSIGGLNLLIEQNTPDSKKFIVDYNKDKITLSFSEDVTLSLGTLAHLYKLLYWSRPNGKTIVPENLLRFNCDIVISEIRNFNTVRKAIETNTLQVIKDNVSRYVYSLRECQFYFNTMAHEDSINMASQMEIFGDGAYSIQFDYKYSTMKLERFVPIGNGLGQYVGYNGGAMWKVGNRGDVSVPSFFTVGENSLNKNGVESPIVVSIPEDNIYDRNYTEDITETETAISSTLDRFKAGSIQKAKELKELAVDTAITSITREVQTYVNSRVAILNKTLNKVLNASGITGVRPPKNIYTDNVNAPGRVFYDVRGQLMNFLGDSIGDILGGGTNRSF